MNKKWLERLLFRDEICTYCGSKNEVKLFEKLEKCRSCGASLLKNDTDAKSVITPPLYLNSEKDISSQNSKILTLEVFDDNRSVEHSDVEETDRYIFVLLMFLTYLVFLLFPESNFSLYITISGFFVNSLCLLFYILFQKKIDSKDNFWDSFYKFRFYNYAIIFVGFSYYTIIFMINLMKDMSQLPL